MDKHNSKENNDIPRDKSRCNAPPDWLKTTIARIVPSLQLAQTEPLLHLTPYSYTFQSSIENFFAYAILRAALFSAASLLPARWQLIAENQHDLRKLFSTFSKLLHRRPETRFPQHDSVKSLVQDFIAFFGNKIKKIRDDLDRSIPDNGLEFRDVAAGCQFTTFANVSLTEPLDLCI